MSNMFEDGCNLTSIDISNFKTNKVHTMKRMFLSCNRLEKLDLCNFNFDNCFEFDNMFYGIPNNAEFKIKKEAYNKIKENNRSYITNLYNKGCD